MAKALQSGLKLDKITLNLEIDPQFIIDQIRGAEIGYWALEWNFRGEDPSAWWLVEQDNVVGVHKFDLQRAYQLALSGYGWILDPDNMDSITGDMWIQLGFLGEIRYG